MIDTAIFDLDGTLLFTLDNLFESANYALKKHGFPLRTKEEIKSFVGSGVQKLIERAVPMGAERHLVLACLDDFKQHYGATMYEKTKPYDGVTELLDKLCKQKIQCAVVSNKYDSAVKELCTKYFGKKIVYAVGESVNVRKKPCPDSVLKVMKKIGSKNCVYIGDSEVDIVTAKNAKIPCISVSWGYKDRDFLNHHGAEIIVDSVEELQNYLLRL